MVANEDTLAAIFGGVVVGELANLAMFAAATNKELADFTWSVFIPTARIAATLLCAYWVWQSYEVRPPGTSQLQVQLSSCRRRFHVLVLSNRLVASAFLSQLAQHAH
jgi:hypothetical protein